MTSPYPPGQTPTNRQRAVSESSRHTSGRDLTGTRRQQLAQGTEASQQFATKRERVLDLLTTHADLVDLLVTHADALELIIRWAERAQAEAREEQAQAELVGAFA
jgi:hypothetical protein